MISIIVLEASITIGVLIYWFYLTHQKSQRQKLAALLILERMENERVNKAKKITHFLQNKMNFPPQATSQSVQFLLAQESMLLSEIVQISGVDENQALQIYNKLQDLLMSYYQAQQVVSATDKKTLIQQDAAPKPHTQHVATQQAAVQNESTQQSSASQVEVPAVHGSVSVYKNVQLSIEAVESIELCQAKFMAYLERKGLVGKDVKAQIHAVDQTLAKEAQSVAAVDQKLAQEESIVAEMEQMLAKEAQSAAAVDQKLAQEESIVAEMEQTLAKEAQSAAAVDQKLAQEESIVAEMEQMLAKEAQSVAAVDQKLAQEESIVAEMEQTLAKEAQSAAAVDQKLAQEESIVAEMEQTLAKEAQSAAAVEQKLEKAEKPA